jgi:large subunit ribosomal protein L21
MFAVVRTGGKQYRVAPGDKIVVEKLDGNAGDQITLGDILLAGEGSDLKSTDGLTVAAEIVAQAKGEKVTVFKKRRRHNYRRKKGHRQQHTILKIVSIGDQKSAKPAKAAKTEAAPAGEAKATPSETKAAKTEAVAAEHQAGEIAGQPTANPVSGNDETETAKPAAKKAAAAAKSAKGGSTENAAPAKAAAKKAPKAK